MKGVRLGLAALLVSACAKSSAGDGPAPQASTAPVASASGPAKAAPTPAASAAGTSTWKGTYKSVEGTFVLPEGVKWKVPESPAGLGEGTIVLTLDRGTGRAQGTVDGALGPATIDGVAKDGHVTASVSRADPGDQGFTGTLQGSVADAGVQGTMNLTQANVTAVRNAPFELAPVR
jgi:hypothetical protein